jgi:hypothetical protein
MDSFQPEFVVQPQPLLCTIGLIDSDSTDTSYFENELFANKRRESLSFVKAIKSNIKIAMDGRNSVTIWDNSIGKSSRLFYITHLHKSIAFPPRKMQFLSNAKTSISSPNSPLFPSSPLYPDGIIHNTWTQKHRELIPSTLVYFVDLYRRVDRANNNGADIQDTVKLERERDTLLCSAINDTRKVIGERGTRFVVVLIIADPLVEIQLEERLNFIRKTCHLDTKTLLVLPPGVGQNIDVDLLNFLTSYATVCIL